MRHTVRLAFALVSLLVVPGRATAEIVYLTSGGTMSVKEHRLDGNQVTLLLRSGGELTCARTLIARIEPDEVPYPEPPTVEVIPAAEPPGLTGVPFADLITAASARHGVNPQLVSALIRVESAYEPTARSPKGAKGLMQLMPGTLKQYDVRDPYDPQSNIEAGIQHLKSLLDRFELSLALAAYNAGEAAVERFRGIPPYPETRNYVRRVLSLVQR